MNTILRFIERQRDNPALARLQLPPLTSLLVTPRFKASAHVVYLLMPLDDHRPLLVAKIGRLPGDSASLRRELGNLQAFQAGRPGGFDSIPRPVIFESYGGHPILLETALAGRALDPRLVRQDRSFGCRLVVDWLTTVTRPAHHPVVADESWFERLVVEPLRTIESLVPLTIDEGRLLERTWSLASRLQQVRLPLPWEHGDLSHPNLILLPDGRLGVVDWETAVPGGLPACDLFFFLTYVAFATHRSRSPASYLSAFDTAFFRADSWTWPYIADYARALQLPAAALAPLFILTWARYTARLLTRLAVDGNGNRLPPATVSWLRSNRFYLLWQSAVAHSENFVGGDGCLEKIKLS